MTNATAWVEGTNAYYFGAQAHLLADDREVAWAEKHVVHNPAHAWIVGKYVEADRANSNGQYFELDGLRMGQPTIAHSPMNINHGGQAVGSFVATELVYPTEAADEGTSGNPYIEALGVVWKAHHPDAFELIQQAHSEGRLYFSMECVPKRIGCIGAAGCGSQFDYAGIMSDTYCKHINDRTADRELIEPHFTGGALIIPPVRPGWAKADVHSLVANHVVEVERVLAEVASETKAKLKTADAPVVTSIDTNKTKPDWTPEEEARFAQEARWHSDMSAVVLYQQYSRSFNPEERHALAKSGKALSDGSFPIVNTADLKNAISAMGRSKNPGYAKSHIIKRAKALGAMSLLPEGWKS